MVKIKFIKNYSYDIITLKYKNNCIINFYNVFFLILI
jgi:hypothetical protein